MASYRVHAILATAHEEDRLPTADSAGSPPTPISSEQARREDFDRQTAETIAGTPALLVATTDPLPRAVELMVEHGVSHLVVVARSLSGLA